ncbi:methanogenesis marker 6 protein [Methanospirillum sp. J.3.6.1-F.2.7.3]|jgi:putative methanogenesis marker protein 6|uniref:Methanogenesis marker 6 protein n=1 Tax=Methanospirillum purgamenti TaxID=2834276 RepID=A0A8E7B1P2_9EURY|nr:MULTISPECIES: methanogenesis marker 6 protein [Methanospirillum]MDX8549160.1 methanogenesis marker 6 protein [Methanospirillum hungatei]NLW76297.1 methanogenesis marker 6 protein [Methanomicrobiales archaeon]QVV88833.1 methanogenesis marker 6 protein [Methanospirillum sp. J.3.6.1-F.2.7.3]
MKDQIPPLYAGTVTKYVFIESYKATPDDIAARAYEVSGGVMIKETCFGLQVTGPEDEVERVIAHIRAFDPAHIYVKDRGFPPGDPRRCRANLGGARPGYFGHEYEMGFIRRIAVGLEKLDESPIQSDKMEGSAAPEGLSVKRLVELIEQEA